MPPAVIVNPHAGAPRKQPSLVRRIAELARGQAHVCVTHDATELAQQLAELAQADCRDVAIVGGDGTASTTLTALWRAFGPQRLPKVSLLRGGTMNTIANSLGVPREKSLALLARTLRAWQDPTAQTSRSRPTIRVQDRLGFLFGTGLWYGFLAEYYTVGNGAPTPWTAARVFGGAVAGSFVNGGTYLRIRNAVPLSVQHDGGRWEAHAYMTVCAGSVEQAGLGFHVFHRAYELAESFHLIAIRGSPAHVFRDLPRIWTNRGLGSDTALETLTSSAVLRSGGDPFGYSVDGDLYMADAELRLELGPRFEFLFARRG